MQGRERTIAFAAGTVGLVSTLCAALVAVAMAAGTVTIGSAPSTKLGKTVVVNAQGLTLYTLSGESKSRQFCTSAECLRFWPPVRVSSKSTTLKAGAGVHGTLGVIRRSGGILQVTLRGVPLYRFSGDKARGQANGEAIVFPGGHVWHAVAAGSPGTKHATPAVPPMPSPNSKTPPTYTAPGYGY
jgi:predicted lipoprotein with Yx(FWY)xxD motif